MVLLSYNCFFTRLTPGTLLLLLATASLVASLVTSLARRCINRTQGYKHDRLATHSSLYGMGYVWSGTSLSVGSLGLIVRLVSVSSSSIVSSCRLGGLTVQHVKIWSATLGGSTPYCAPPWLTALQRMELALPTTPALPIRLVRTRIVHSTAHSTATRRSRCARVVGSYRAGLGPLGTRAWSWAQLATSESPCRS